jgi:hypothetical protein
MWPPMHAIIMEVLDPLDVVVGEALASVVGGVTLRGFVRWRACVVETFEASWP